MAGTGLYSSFSGDGGLPGRVYADPEFHALECRDLFPRAWVAAAAASALPEAGDVLPVTVASNALVFVRDHDGRYP